MERWTVVTGTENLGGRRLTAIGLAMLGGIILIVSGTRASTSGYSFVVQELSKVVTDQTFLSVINIVVAVLIAISYLGGILVILGAYLLYRNHVGAARFMMFLGAGVGIPWLIFVALPLLLTQGPLAVVAEHSVLGWIGLLLSIIAAIIAK